MILLSYNKGATQIDDYNKNSQADAAVDGNTDGYWNKKYVLLILLLLLSYVRRGAKQSYL